VGEHCMQPLSLKGTVARYFWLKFFFKDLLYMGPRFQG
jgi:hypothetical protein